MRKILAIMTIVILTGCSAKTEDQARTDKSESTAHMAHENYVEAINSNDLETLMGMLTDDVVFMAAGEAPLVGKAAVKPWCEGYYQAYKTFWVKTVDEFQVIDSEWAFERYSWHSTDTSLEDQSVYEDTGWGLVIYHRDADGKWRVARDSWGPDHPIAY